MQTSTISTQSQDSGATATEQDALIVTEVIDETSAGSSSEEELEQRMLEFSEEALPADKDFVIDYTMTPFKEGPLRCDECNVTLHSNAEAMCHLWAQHADRLVPRQPSRVSFFQRVTKEEQMPDETKRRQRAAQKIAGRYSREATVITNAAINERIEPMLACRTKLLSVDFANMSCKTLASAVKLLRQYTGAAVELTAVTLREDAVAESGEII